MFSSSNWIAASLIAAFLSATTGHAKADAITYGVAAGDIGAVRAIIWSRTDAPATMHVVIRKKDGTVVDSDTVAVVEEHDYTGKILFDGLEPDTAYRYHVWFDEAPDSPEKSQGIKCGRFHTAPAPDQPKAVTFAWGGDVAGQNVCRDLEQGFPVFKAIKGLKPDFFIGLGDMIYADNACESQGLYGNAQVPDDFGPAANLANYWTHWKYNRKNRSYRGLLARTPYYAIWDDHEVVNDFGPLHDTRDILPYTPGEHLLPIGRHAFFDYNPVAENPDTPKWLYRNVRWGQHLELFILDNRQYRDANFEPDSPESPKTMLGREQLVWLKERLKSSDATWKIIVSSVPMSIPTGSPPEKGRDGWVNFDQHTGFEHELKDMALLI